MSVEYSKVVEAIKYSSKEELFHDLSYGGRIYKLLERRCVFRGHSDSSYKLVPSLFRKEAKVFIYENYASSTLTKYENILRLGEYSILKDFYQLADMSGLELPLIENKYDLYNLPFVQLYAFSDLWIPDELCELAGMAQHYGLPTRLMDWTTDVNVALYFASYGVFRRKTENRSSLLDKLRVRANHIRKIFGLNDVQEPERMMDIWAIDISKVEPLRLKNKDFRLKFVRPQYYRNSNLSAQKGLFSLWQIDSPKDLEDLKFKNLTPIDLRPLDEQICAVLTDVDIMSPILYRFSIPQRFFSDIICYLSTLGYDSANLFPGFKGVADAIKEKRILRKYNHNGESHQDQNDEVLSQSADSDQ